MSKRVAARKNDKSVLQNLSPEPIVMVDHTGETEWSNTSSITGPDTRAEIGRSGGGALGALKNQDINSNTDTNHEHQGWAKNVAIPEYETIEGQFSKANAYVVWVIKIEKLTGGIMTICRRYREFDNFRQRLVREFPNRTREIPELPPKSAIAKFRPDFLEQRRRGLQYFLLCVLLNPAFAYSEAVKGFIKT